MQRNGEPRGRERNVEEPLETYYARCIPEGNVRNYFPPVKSTAVDRILGQTSLNLRNPIHNIRDPDTSNNNKLYILLLHVY